MFKIVGEYAGEGFVIFLIMKDIIFVGTSVIDVIEVLWPKATIIVFAWHTMISIS